MWPYIILAAVAAYLLGRVMARSKINVQEYKKAYNLGYEDGYAKALKLYTQRIKEPNFRFSPANGGEVSKWTQKELEDPMITKKVAKKAPKKGGRK